MVQGRPRGGPGGAHTSAGTESSASEQAPYTVTSCQCLGAHAAAPACISVQEGGRGAKMHQRDAMGFTPHIGRLVSTSLQAAAWQVGMGPAPRLAGS